MHHALGSSDSNGASDRSERTRSGGYDTAHDSEGHVSRQRRESRKAFGGNFFSGFRKVWEYFSPSESRESRWHFRVLYVSFGAIVCVLVIFLMLYVVEKGSKVQPARYLAWVAGGLCTLGAVLISLYGIILHLNNYKKPRLQKWVIRVLWFVPVYAISSFCSLSLYLDIFCHGNPILNPSDNVIFDTVRDIYEAFAIYSFLSLCLAWLEDIVPSGDAVSHIAQRPAGRLMAPYSSGQPVGPGFLQYCRAGTMDYVVVQLTSAAITLISVKVGGGPHGLFGMGEVFSIQKLYIYIVISKSIAQTWAIWCLTLLARMVYQELKEFQLASKFLCIKLIVFFTFWQSVLLSFLLQMGWISVERDWTQNWACIKEPTDKASLIDHLLICFEMLGFAIAHLRIFSWRDFQGESADQQFRSDGMTRGVRAMFDVSDVNADIRARITFYFRNVRNRIARLFRKRKYDSMGESLLHLEGEEEGL